MRRTKNKDFKGLSFTKRYADETTKCHHHRRSPHGSKAARRAIRQETKHGEFYGALWSEIRSSLRGKKGRRRAGESA